MAVALTCNRFDLSHAGCTDVRLTNGCNSYGLCAKSRPHLSSSSSCIAISPLGFQHSGEDRVEQKKVPCSRMLSPPDRRNVVGVEDQFDTGLSASKPPRAARVVLNTADVQRLLRNAHRGYFAVERFSATARLDLCEVAPFATMPTEVVPSISVGRRVGSAAQTLQRPNWV